VFHGGGNGRTAKKFALPTGARRILKDSDYHTLRRAASNMERAFLGVRQFTLNGQAVSCYSIESFQKVSCRNFLVIWVDMFDLCHL
jgi:hypothetical protein